MKLINGKFYEGEKEVALEFGNKEQIRLMNEHLTIVNAFSGPGFEVDADIKTIHTTSVSFRCLCGFKCYTNEKEINNEDPYEAIAKLDGESFECRKCQTKYICRVNEDYNLVVKYKK